MLIVFMYLIGFVSLTQGMLLPQSNTYNGARDFIQETHNALALVAQGEAGKALWDVIDIIDNCPAVDEAQIAQLIGGFLTGAAANTQLYCRLGTVQIAVAALFFAVPGGIMYGPCGFRWGFLISCIGTSAGSVIARLCDTCFCSSYVKYKKADTKLYNFLSKHNALPQGYKKNCAERAFPCI